MPEPPDQTLSGVQKLKRWIRPVMLLLTVAFVVLTGVDLAARWESGRVELHAGFVVLAALPIIVANVLQGVAWIVLVERMTHQPSPRLAALSLYLDSQLARYAPGKVGLPLVRMEGAPRVGLSRGLVGVSILIESLSALAAGAIVSFFLLSVVEAPSEGLGAIAGPWQLPILGAAVAGALVLIGVDRRRVPSAVLSKLSLGGEGPLTPVFVPAIQLIYWLMWSLHGFLIAMALGADARTAFSIVAFVPLANLLGFVAFGAPAGVGVREAVLIYGLAPVLGGPGALAAALLSRVQHLAADVLVWIVARFMMRRSARSRAEGLSALEPETDSETR